MAMGSKLWGEALRLPGPILMNLGTGLMVADTGNEPLRFLACWPCDADHDYAMIDERGFSLRVMRRDGSPEVVAQL
jgi:glucose-6-phosphate isomerase